MGCVLQAGLGQNPARQAGLKAGLPDTLSAKTINKVCGSGLEAVMLAAQSIKAGDNQLVVAGGFENMTAAPHFARVREGVKYGRPRWKTTWPTTASRCAFECWAMGNAADHIAKKYEISRADQDRFSVQSHQRAAEATKERLLQERDRRPHRRAVPGQEVARGVSADEGIRADSTVEGLAKLRPVFGAEGTVTAANASQISDGGGGAGRRQLAKAEQLGAQAHRQDRRVPHQRRVAQGHLRGARSAGIAGALKKAGLSVKDIDLFEINEAFAAQVLCNIKDARERSPRAS
jgi:acetyl-CoA C-acetyltransferase